MRLFTEQAGVRLLGAVVIARRLAVANVTVWEWMQSRRRPMPTVQVRYGLQITRKVREDDFLKWLQEHKPHLVERWMESYDK